ncbi:hypothetical protein EVB56_018 [Rhizobium phage RHph_Y1_10]|nr:hypothetical protein EVB56_018 [Rhizobium phage RHph_Y1_10]
MQIEIKGKISADPRDRVLAIEAVTKSICQKTGLDPAEGVMMLLTAAAHLMAVYSGKSADQNILVLAGCLGNATVAADGFFKLRPVPVAANGGPDGKQ